MTRALAARTSRAGVHLGVCFALELLVENTREDIVTEFGVFQAQLLELGLGLSAQGMRPARPEVGDRGANGGVGIVGVGVDVLGIGDLALGCGVDAVDLGTGEGAQRG